MSDQLRFIVKSSSNSETYDVYITGTGSTARMSCSCVAASYGTLCKHRTALLYGDGSMLAEGSDDVASAVRAFAGTAAMQTAEELLELEKLAAKTSKAIASAKRALVRHLT